MHDTATLKNQTCLHVGGMMSLYVDIFAQLLFISAFELQFKQQINAGL